MSESAGNPSVGRVEVVVEERPGWVRVYAVFQSEFQRQVEFDRTPGLIDRTLTHWLQGRPGLHVRATLPILDGGTTVAVHLWYDGTS